MKRGWIITEDHLEGGEYPETPGHEIKDKCSAAGTMGPSDRSLGIHDDPATADEIIAQGEVFQMRDDDGELDYTFRMLNPYPNDGIADPLDDYGAPNAGCTGLFTKVRRLLVERDPGETTEMSIWLEEWKLAWQ